MSELRTPSQEKVSPPWLKVDSFAELMAHEKEIVDRINRFPNGAQLFLIHPFLLLKDVGVELSDKAEQEVRRSEPMLSGLSAVPYQAMKNTEAKQNVRFHLRGLFERKGDK